MRTKPKKNPKPCGKTEAANHVGSGDLLGSKTVTLKIGFRLIKDKSFKRAISMAKRLKSSKRFSNGFLGLIERLLLDGVKIENIDLPAGRTGMACRVTVAQDYLDLMAALLASDAFIDWKVPCHKCDVVCLPPNGGADAPPTKKL